jgi:hypothetical protein
VAQWLQPVVQFIGDREYLARCRASSVAGVQTLEAHLVLVLPMRHSILVPITTTFAPVPEPREYCYEHWCAAPHAPIA